MTEWRIVAIVVISHANNAADNSLSLGIAVCCIDAPLDLDVTNRM